MLGRATQPAIDLATWTATQGPRIFGTISRPLTGLNQRAAVGGDFDLDGLPDLALRLPEVEAHAAGSGLTQIVYGVASLTARDYEIGESDAGGGSLLIRGERAISATVASRRTQVDALEWNGDGRVDLVIDDQIVDGAALGRTP